MVRCELCQCLMLLLTVGTRGHENNIKVAKRQINRIKLLKIQMNLLIKLGAASPEIRKHE